MVALRSRLVRDVLLPANLIALALILFGVLASTVEGDLRLVPRAGVGPPSAAPAEPATLTVKVVHVRNATGKVLVWVYGSGPLQDGANIVARQTLAASPAGVTAVFPGMARRAYAVVAVHDENGNGSVDMSPGGPPAEGIGTSGTSDPKKGPPSFDDTRFVLDRDALELEIPVVYR